MNGKRAGLEAINPDSASQQRFISIADASADQHLNGEYFRKPPTWYIDYSPWKADNIHRFLERRKLNPKTICEVGCGAGEVLRELQMKMDPSCQFWGYDVAPPAIEMAKQKGKRAPSLDISVQSAFRTGAFAQRRNVHSHFHHFNKETALGTLEYAGFEIVDYFDPSNLAVSRLAKLAKPIRMALFGLAPDLTVRLFGGYSPMVLTR